MATLSLDTGPKIEELQIQALRKMSPWRKVDRVCSMNRTLRARVDLILGPELAARALGPGLERRR